MWRKLLLFRRKIHHLSKTTSNHNISEWFVWNVLANTFLLLANFRKIAASSPSPVQTHCDTNQTSEFTSLVKDGLKGCVLFSEKSAVEDEDTSSSALMSRSEESNVRNSIFDLQAPPQGPIAVSFCSAWLSDSSLHILFYKQSLREVCQRISIDIFQYGTLRKERIKDGGGM